MTGEGPVETQIEKQILAFVHDECPLKPEKPYLHSFCTMVRAKAKEAVVEAVTCSKHSVDCPCELAWQEVMPEICNACSLPTDVTICLLQGCHDVAHTSCKVVKTTPKRPSTTKQAPVTGSIAAARPMVQQQPNFMPMMGYPQMMQQPNFMMNSMMRPMGAMAPKMYPGMVNPNLVPNPTPYAHIKPNTGIGRPRKNKQELWQTVLEISKEKMAPLTKDGFPKTRRIADLFMPCPSDGKWVVQNVHQANKRTVKKFRCTCRQTADLRRVPGVNLACRVVHFRDGPDNLLVQLSTWIPDRMHLHPMGVAVQVQLKSQQELVDAGAIIKLTELPATHNGEVPAAVKKTTPLPKPPISAERKSLMEEAAKEDAEAAAKKASKGTDTLKAEPVEKTSPAKENVATTKTEKPLKRKVADKVSAAPEESETPGRSRRSKRNRL
jgi:hypothetical protein